MPALVTPGDDAAGTDDEALALVEAMELSLMESKRADERSTNELHTNPENDDVTLNWPSSLLPCNDRCSFKV